MIPLQKEYDRQARVSRASAIAEKAWELVIAHGYHLDVAFGIAKEFYVRRDALIKGADNE